MNIGRTRITYVYTSRPTFVDKDVRLLSSVFDVREYQFKSPKSLSIVVSFVRQALFLVRSFGRTDAIICMFAGYHSLLPALWARLNGIPCFIIAGGTDAVKYPSLSYGNFTKSIYGAFTALSFRKCSMILPVHETLARFRNEYYDKDEQEQGFLEHVPGLKTPYVVIPNGFDAPVPNRDVPENRSGFVTVASVDSEQRFILKGIDLIYEVGSRFPHHRFTVVGMSFRPAISRPANVEIVGFVGPDEVFNYLYRSAFYLQLSISEGHPNALCEGMAAGCIPIGSAVGAIPEIIGETGFILQRRDPDLLYETLRRALEAPRELGEQARGRIESMFPLSRRLEALTDVLTSRP